MTNTPWLDFPEIWKTESAFLSWIRGGIRRSLWNRHPVKLEFIKRNRTKIPNPNPRGKLKEVWGATCNITGEILPLKCLEVDHIQGNHSLRSLNDLQSFIEGIVLVKMEDLQFVSKEAHKVKSYAEKEGITFEEAYNVKRAIELVKTKQDKQWLIDRGITPASNQAARRQQILEVLK